MSYCKRPKRVDERADRFDILGMSQRYWCPGCGVWFIAFPPEVPGHLGYATEGFA